MSRSLDNEVSWLTNRLDELRDSAAPTKEFDTTLLIPSQAPAVLSILGPQGIGKSTTLKYLCDRVAADSERVMTPVVSPERFADGDTLFGWVLAALNDLMPKDLPEASDDRAPARGDGLSLLGLADLLRRQEALARSTHQGALPAVTANPDELAEGVAAVTAAGLHLVTGWVTLLNGLASHVSQVVIPVDDADQVPGLLTTLLRDLRWLTVHPLVAVVVCVNEDMLLQSLLSGTELTEIDRDARTRHAKGVLTKALPRHLRLSVTPVPNSDRPRFVPPNERERLIELLRKFEISNPPEFGPHSIGDLFEMKLGDSTVASPYAETLPEIPRQLDQIWRELRGIATDPSRDQRAKTTAAAHRLIVHGIERAHEEVPNLPHDTINFFTSNQQGLSVEFDFDQVRASAKIGAGYTVYGYAREGRVSVRRFDELLFRKRLDEPGPKGVPQLSSELPHSFTNAHYLALDLAEPEDLKDPPLTLWGYKSRPSLPGGSNWYGTIDVDYQGEDTDHRFAPVPAWENYYDYYLYIAAWNTIWTAVRNSGSERQRELLEWALLKHMLFVTEVQRHRAIDPELIEPIVDEIKSINAGNWAPSADLDRLAAALDQLYGGSAANRSVRDNDMDYWIEVYLPWSADALLQVPELGERILEMRNELLAKHDTSHQANEKCAEALDTRLRKHLSSDWIEVSLGLLERFDSGAAARLAELHQVAREEDDAELEMYSSTLEERGIPQEVVGHLFLMGVTGQVAEELRVAGLPDAAVHALAQRFPPVKSDAETAAPDSKEDHRDR